MTAMRAAAIALSLLAAIVLAGCATHPATPASFHELRLARAFQPLPVYWVGRSFDGLALTAADDGYDYDPTIGMRVFYGDCHKRTSLATGGCKLPLQITSVIYEPHSNAGLGPSRTTVIRGAPAVIFNAGTAIEIYTGHVAIDIRADSGRRALAAAQQLAALNGPGSPSDRLAPPQFPPGVSSDARAKAIATELRSVPAQPTTALPQLLPRRG